MFNQYTSYLQALTFNSSSLHEEDVEKIVDFINSTTRRSKRHSLRVSDTLFIHETFWIDMGNLWTLCGNLLTCFDYYLFSLLVPCFEFSNNTGVLWLGKFSNNRGVFGLGEFSNNKRVCWGQRWKLCCKNLFGKTTFYFHTLNIFLY